MAEIAVTTGDGSALFNLPDDAICPRVGELIHFAFTAHNEDTWAKDSWAHNRKMDGTVWRVLHVEHHINRSDWNKVRSSIWVTVRREPATTRKSK